MLNPVSHITFTDPSGLKSLEFSFLYEGEIEKSRKNLTTTCKIKLPRKIIVLNGDINTVLKRGSKVVVKLGYEPELKTEFTGYISKIGAQIPTEIICEDEIWNLKQNSFSKSWKQVSLNELISFIYPGKTRLAQDLQLGGFVIKSQSTAQVLDALKKFGLQCYFDVDGVLVVDFAGSTNQKPIELRYDFNVNIIDNDLEYNRKEDIRIRCKGISKLSNGKKIEYVFGDPDGDLRTLNFSNLSLEALKRIVKKELEKLKQDGFKNGFTTFGIPYAQPGYIAVLTDHEYPERNGSYLIEGVTTTFGVDGFRRKITLERKLK